MLDKIKSFLVELFFKKSKQVGMFMLTSYIISAVILGLIMIPGGIEFSLILILEFIFTPPFISIFVIIARIALILFHKVIPMESGIIKAVIDLVIIIFVITAVSLGAGDLLDTTSELFSEIFIYIFGVIYIAFTVFLLMANKLRKAKENPQEETPEV